jgi:hypothetical protein
LDEAKFPHHTRRYKRKYNEMAQQSAHGSSSLYEQGSPTELSSRMQQVGMES